MAPAWGSSSWRGRGDDHRKGNPVVVSMESPNFSVMEIEGPDVAFRPVEKSRNKNAQQVTWVLLLKVNHAVGCVAWLAGAIWALLGAVNKRLIFREGVAVDHWKLGKGRVLFQVILGFLAASLIILGFEALCELPESYETYRKQQHRWHSGPMLLFRLCLPAVLTAKITVLKKGNLMLVFFLPRKLILPFYSFTLFLRCDTEARVHTWESEGWEREDTPECSRFSSGNGPTAC